MKGMVMGVATKIKDLESFRGQAALYSVEPAIQYEEIGGSKNKTNFIVVSAARVPFMLFGGDSRETYIFPADQEGEVVYWGELDGSYRGGLDHKKALNDAGYTLNDMAE